MDDYEFARLLEAHLELLEEQDPNSPQCFRVREAVDLIRKQQRARFDLLHHRWALVELEKQLAAKREARKEMEHRISRREGSLVALLRVISREMGGDSMKSTQDRGEEYLRKADPSRKPTRLGEKHHTSVISAGLAKIDKDRERARGKSKSEVKHTSVITAGLAKIDSEGV